MTARIARVFAAGICCGLLGSIIGAVFGGLAGLPFFPPAGPLAGLFMGAIGGFVAGFIGASFGGPPGFRVGGIVGAFVSMAVFPFAVFIVIPPALALALGILFGGYLDSQIRMEQPEFYIGKIVKDMIADIASYPDQTRKRVGIITSIIVVLIVAFSLILAWLNIVNRT